MNKIILNIGLIVFCMAVVFFARMGIPLQDVILKSTLIFAIVTLMLGLIALIFLRAVSKASLGKGKNVSINNER